MAEADPSVVIFGAGALGRVMFDMLSAEGIDPVAFVDDSAGGKLLLGRDVLPPTQEYLKGKSVVLAMLSGSARRRASERIASWGAIPYTFISKRAFVSPTATVEPGSTIFPYAQVMSCSTVLRGSHVHHFCIIGHDASIGPYSSLAPHCCIGGGTRIAEDCVLGQGVVTCPGVRVGTKSTIGAATYVGGHVEAGSRVICPTSPTFKGRPGR